MGSRNADGQRWPSSWDVRTSELSNAWPPLQLSRRDKPGLTEAVFHRLFSGTKSRHVEKTSWPFPGPLQQLQKAILGTCFLLKCLKLLSLAASAPLNYLIIVPLLLENHRIFLKGRSNLSTPPAYQASMTPLTDGHLASLIDVEGQEAPSLPKWLIHQAAAAEAAPERPCGALVSSRAGSPEIKSWVGVTPVF